MPRKPRKPLPALCGKCAQEIDMGELMLALKRRVEYRHTCGRILTKGSGEDEPR